MMLILSPLGWFYYFSLLVLPLCLTWNSALDETPSSLKLKILWLTGMFLINFPMDYVRTFSMVSITSKLTIYSFHFYGLLILTHLTRLAQVKTPVSIEPQSMYFICSSLIILIFGFSVLLLSILKHFM